MFLLTVRPSHEKLIWLRSTHCTLYCPQPGQASDWSPRVSTGRSLVNFGVDHKLECECILFSPSFSLMRRSNGMSTSTSMVKCVQSLDLNEKRNTFGFMLNCLLEKVSQWQTTRLTDMRGEIYFTMMRSRKILSLKNLKTIQMTLSSKNGVNLPASILRLYYFCTHEQFLLFCILCLLCLILIPKVHLRML